MPTDAIHPHPCVTAIIGLLATLLVPGVTGPGMEDHTTRTLRGIMLRSRCVLLCMAAIPMAAAAVPAAALAQQVPGLEPGVMVRVYAPAVETRAVIGRIRVADDERLTVLRRQPEEIVTLQAAHVRRLDVGHPRTRPRGSAIGAGWGALVGGGLGTGLGLASTNPDFTRGETALIVGAVLGTVGAAAGGLIGLLNPGHRWEVRWIAEPAGSGPGVENAAGRSPHF